MFHNVGQIIVAMFIVESTNLVYYLPFLIVTGIVTGVLIGFISEMVIKRIKIYFK
ncbi:MAG: Gx transporter family protein [Eubacteriales bacterium]|nr:Gx transporter family protein [Eubacteriales bacterium]